MHHNMHGYHYPSSSTYLWYCHMYNVHNNYRFEIVSFYVVSVPYESWCYSADDCGSLLDGVTIVMNIPDDVIV